MRHCREPTWRLQVESTRGLRLWLDRCRPVIYSQVLLALIVTCRLNSGGSAAIRSELDDIGGRGICAGGAHLRSG
jgi:hypothetical protein